MPSAPRRGRFEIYADIMLAIKEDALRNGEARATRVQTMSNVPYSRFKEYLEVLRSKGLLSIVETTIALTPAGLAYLKDYEKVKEFLITFGLD
jgi:predicted transcriptional regulator